MALVHRVAVEGGGAVGDPWLSTTTGGWLWDDIGAAVGVIHLKCRHIELPKALEFQ